MIRYNTKRYWGYSTDTKPINAQIGDRFLEMDTQLEYVFSDYNKWELIGLNFTGGTVTGATIFTSGLTANTISATTYQNLPTFITGATYFQGETTYSTSTGGTFSVFGPSNYNPGVISGDTSWSSNNDGSINLPQIRVALHDNPNFFEPLKFYSISSGTTGVGSLPALINNDTNYVIIEYNNGIPRYNVLDNDGTVDWSSILLYMIIYRANNFIHVLEFGDEGAGLPSKLNERMVYTDRFARESGCSLGLSGSTGVVTLSSGVVWNGTNRQIVNDVTSLGLFFRNFHSGGTWVYTTTANTVNNLYYDNGTDLVLATNGKYLVNWYFRGQELNDHLYEVVSNGEFDNILLADASSEPNLPELITSHAFLVGRIIIAVSATTGITQSAFSSVFQPSGAPGVHNDLTNIQGGLPNQYYHLDSNKYNNLALTNIDNNFNVGQTFNSGLTANTISATTYQNLPATPFLPLSGGTVTGATSFTNGLTANTISATTLTSSTETIIGRIPTSATGSVSTGTNPRNMYIQGKYAYVVNTSITPALQIFDVSNPSSPVLVGSGATGSGTNGVYVQGRYSYVVNTGAATLQIFDVSNPSSPVLVGSGATSSGPIGIYIQGRYAYVVNQTSSTLQIFDVSNPSSPVSVGTVSTGLIPIVVYVQGRYAYIVNQTSPLLQIFDVSNPSSPVSVGTVSTGVLPRGMYVQGKYVYVVNQTSPLLQIFDVSNPSSPVSVGSVSTGLSPYGVYVQGRYAYVTNFTSNTLQIFDVSNPSLPVSVGTVSTGSSPRLVYVQGRYAYVINETSSNLQIFDVGGSYIQQLEAGGILTSTLESVGNVTIGNDLAVVGGLNVSQSANILGNLSATNMRVVSGLTSTTISATTYQNLPTDIRVTGGTYSGSTIIFTNNTGGTFNVTGITTSSAFTGGTVTGETIFTGGLTANTISATTYQNLPPSLVKSINSVSGNTNAGSNQSTDYIYFASNTITITLPTAINNTNSYVIKNVGTGTITINTTSSQTIDGSLTAPIRVQYLSLTIISDGANWNII